MTASLTSQAIRGLPSPCNIDGGHQIRISCKTAGGAPELRLTGTISLRAMTATRTRSAGIRRRNLHQSAAAPRQLVVQLPLKFMPALIQNRLVQSRFAPDPSPGMADRSLRRPGHVRHPQLLDVDDRVVLADLGQHLWR